MKSLIPNRSTMKAAVCAVGLLFSASVLVLAASRPRIFKVSVTPRPVSGGTAHFEIVTSPVKGISLTLIDSAKNRSLIAALPVAPTTETRITTSYNLSISTPGKYVLEVSAFTDESSAVSRRPFTVAP